MSSLPITAVTGGGMIRADWLNELDVIKDMIGASDLDESEFRAFVAVAKNVGLNPLAKQIYALPFQKKIPGTDQTRTCLTIVTGIDGYRTIAERSGSYAGSDEVEFGPDIKFQFTQTFWENRKPIERQVTLEVPEYAKITVYKIVGGIRCPFTAKVLWREYFPVKKPGRWTDMPYHMLGKCAEAVALRKAFPNDLSGLFTADEVERMVSDNQAVRPAVALDDDGQVALEANTAAPAGPIVNEAAEAFAQAAASSATQVLEAEVVVVADPQRDAEPSDKQRAMFFSLWAEIGGPAHVDRVERHVNYEIWGKAIGRTISSYSDLTKAEVAKIIDWMESVKSGQKKRPGYAKRIGEVRKQLETHYPPAVNSLKELTEVLEWGEEQVDKLLGALLENRSADEVAVAGYAKGFRNLGEFVILASDPFFDEEDEPEELTGDKDE